MTHNSTTGQSAIAAAETAEHDAGIGNPDPFPPEGTDEKVLDAGNGPTHALTESDRVKATQAAIASEGKPALEKP